MMLEVSAVDHIYVAVTDLQRSIAFYDPLMKVLGFRKGTKPIAGEEHVHYFNRITQYSLRPARGARSHDPYSPGLHHLCFRMPTREQIDAAAREIRALGIEVSEPQLCSCTRDTGCASSCAITGTSSPSSRTRSRKPG